MQSPAIIRAFVIGSLLLGLTGCGGFPLPPGPSPTPTPTPPDEPFYVGSAACAACHPNLAAWQARHGHSQALKAIQGLPPVYPDVDREVGPPSPPAGFDWTDIGYVIGGYTKSAQFVDVAGFVMTDGTAGTETQYNLDVSAAQLPAEFVSFMPEQVDPYPYPYECFRCHTTGPQSLEDSDGERQNNRPGVEGTWAEEGVQCENCHGPGSLHVNNPQLSNININTTPSACSECHADPDDPTTIAAADNYIIGNQQSAEVAAGPHRGFACTLCHSAHASSFYEPEEGIRNECQDCHWDQNMALHEGKVFVWGDHVEEVTCVSCHMTTAAFNAASNELELPRDLVARIGDTRTHLVVIETRADDPLDMFTEDGSEVALDEDGMAFVTSCYVCQRCHHGRGNAFTLVSNDACQNGTNIHGP